MCGIVGYTGNSQAAPILLHGLSKLEYRGYDSAGMAVRDGEKNTERFWQKRPTMENLYPVPAESDIPDGPLTENPLRSTPIPI